MSAAQKMVEGHHVFAKIVPGAGLSVDVDARVMATQWLIFQEGLPTAGTT